MKLIDFLESHRAAERASFHMPGHKGAVFFERLGYGGFIKDLAGCDVTEIPGADDLRHASGPIKEIEDKYSELYGSDRSLISVNGSSAAIMAAIKTCVRPGHELIAASNAHVSVMNGAKLAGANIVFVDTEDPGRASGESPDPDVSPLSGVEIPGTAMPERSGRGAYGIVTAGDIAASIDEHPNADAVIVVSPDYLGFMADIKEIAAKVHERGKVLIVDQAHGAHLKFFDEINGASSPDTAAENLGADIIVNSTHKTLASFTQSSEVDLFATGTDGQGFRFDPERYEEELLTLESTSPSYILMASHAVNVDILERFRGELMGSWKSELGLLYGSLDELAPGIALKFGDDCAYSRDDTKVVLDARALGMTGSDLGSKLMERGIYPEFSSAGMVLLMTGIGTTSSDREALLAALAGIAQE